VFSILGAVIITGIIIYGAKVYTVTNHKYSGAFAITIVAGIVILIAGVMVLLDWMGKGAQKNMVVR
jgi:flagellar basal body-associated protein FliL